jgi:hypothetical protein
MLAKQQITNTTTTVYTCPTGKTAVVRITVVSPDGSSVPITIKIGDGTTDLVFWTATTNFVRTDPIWLTAGDVVKVSTTGNVNVFIDGKEY